MQIKNLNMKTGDCHVHFGFDELKKFKEQAKKFCRTDVYNDEVGNRYLNFIISNNVTNLVKGCDW